MWALLATLIVNIGTLPVFEITSFVFFTGFIASSLVNCFRGKKVWQRGSYPISLLIIGTLGIFGNAVCFVIALQYAPAAHADLINYLWPLFLIILIPLLPDEDFSFKHAMSGILAFLGVFLLITNGGTFEQKISSDYALGYFWALVGSLSWTMYTFCSKRHNKPTPDIITHFCLGSFLLSLTAHLAFESFIMPSSYQLAVMMIMGCTTHSLAFFCWDYGIKKGDFRLLCVLSYTNPITSVLFLIAFGFAEPSLLLWIATFMVSSASFVYIIKWKKLLKVFQAS